MHLSKYIQNYFPSIQRPLLSISSKTKFYLSFTKFIIMDIATSFLFSHYQKNNSIILSSINILNSHRWVQLLSRVQLFATPRTTALQASLSITNSQSPPKPMSIESVMPSNHLTLCCPVLLLPSIFHSIRVFSNESALCIRWPKYWSFSFNISPFNEQSGLISFRMDWLDLLKCLHKQKTGIFLTQGSNLGLLHCRQILYHLSHKESPYAFFFHTHIHACICILCNNNWTD